MVKIKSVDVVIVLVLSVYSSLAADGDLRLIGSFSSSSGRLEIHYNGIWGTVCGDDFSSTDARVACRQLGYSTYSIYGRVGTLGYSQGTGRIWLDNVNCYSYSTRLSQCSHSGWGVHDCSHYEDIALQCSSSSGTTGDNYNSSPRHADGASTGGILVGGIFMIIFCIVIVYAAVRKSGGCIPRIPPPVTHSVCSRSYNLAALSHRRTTASTTSPYSTKPQEPPATFPEKSELQTAPPPSYNDAHKYPPGDKSIPNRPGPCPAATNLSPQPPCSDYPNPAACHDSPHKETTV